jgi:hypothetical protein
VIINKIESSILQINFFSGEELLVKVGYEEWFVNEIGGRKEEFKIAYDERLIGCKLHTEEAYPFYFRGVTWMKIKEPKFRE